MGGYLWALKTLAKREPPVRGYSVFSEKRAKKLTAEWIGAKGDFYYTRYLCKFECK